jgi:hypothetical protein
MANLIKSSQQDVHVYSTEVLHEYIRRSSFEPYMSSKGGIINMKNELNGSAGSVINMPVISQLRGNVFRGDAVMVGNEDAQTIYNMRVYTDVVRTSETVKLTDKFKVQLDLAAEAKTAVTNRLAKALRTDIVTALQSVPVPGNGTGTLPADDYVAYGSASPAQQNAWLAANSDRVLYGALNSNNTGVHATSIANINGDTTKLNANKLSGAVVSLARAKARKTETSNTFAINPYQTKNGSEWFVMFVDANGYRDLKKDQLVYAANKDARPRETDIEKNPIFSGTNVLYYDGVMIVECPELPTVATGVGYAHLCGVQAVNIGWSQKIKTSFRKEDDYEMTGGIGVTEIRGQAKGSVALTQVGMVSVFHTSQDDA